MKYLAFIPVLALPLGAESLHYTINWQSGLSLGEAALQAQKAAPSGTSAPAEDGGWSFDLTLDAAVPGFTIRDEYHSRSDAKLCSEVLERTATRGTRKSSETLTFDQQRKTVKRETQGGGTSQVQTSECAHDALAFLQFVRQELAQGRLVQNQAVHFGSKYEVQLTYVGTETVRQGDKRVEADKVRTSIRGPKSDVTVEIYFAHDEVRTPVMARLPLALGVFTVELLP